MMFLMEKSNGFDCCALRGMVAHSSAEARNFFIMREKYELSRPRSRIRVYEARADVRIPLWRGCRKCQLASDATAVAGLISEGSILRVGQPARDPQSESG